MYVGVPQGSVLGPKLIIIYMNDICNVSKVFKFILFADDTNLFYCDSNSNELNRRTNTELSKLHVWFVVNRLSVNVTKTNYMMFGNFKLNNSISIKINKEALDKVEVTTCLGILISDKLMWKNHISLVKSKLVVQLCTEPTS